MLAYMGIEDAGGRISEKAHQEIEELRKAVDDLYERSLISDSERIADHIYNMAKSIA